MQGNAADGNQPVDLLFCVPPGQVIRDGAVHSVAGNHLRAWEEEVWDGVSTEVRDSYPFSVRQLRVIQYDSCRGLEGWVVVNLGIDDFFRYKEVSWKPPAGGDAGVFADDPQAAERFAVRWLMIPLCRAVDTLVLQVGQGPSKIRDALERVAHHCSDFVKWHKACGVIGVADNNTSTKAVFRRLSLLGHIEASDDARQWVVSPLVFDRTACDPSVSFWCGQRTFAWRESLLAALATEVQSQPSSQAPLRITARASDVDKMYRSLKALDNPFEWQEGPLALVLAANLLHLDHWEESLPVLTGLVNPEHAERWEGSGYVEPAVRRERISASLRGTDGRAG